MMFVARHHRVRVVHPHLRGTARMRPHVGGARHRDEGAPLLRRVRPDAVVDPPAQQAGRDRVRRQGRPAGRLLRHRGHDVDRRDRTRGRAVRDVQAEDVEARRRAGRGPRHELRRRSGADLRHRRDLGSAQPASADHRRSSAKPLVSQPEITKGKLGDCSGPRPAAAAGIQRGRRHRQGRRHAVGTLRRDGRPRCASCTGPTPFVVRARRQRRSPPSSTSRRRSASAKEDGRRSRPTVGAIGISAAQFRADAVQPALGGARHVRVHRRPGRRAGQVAGQDPDQGRRAGALHRRRRTRSRDADQRGRAPASSAATPSRPGCGWHSGSSWPS